MKLVLLFTILVTTFLILPSSSWALFSPCELTPNEQIRYVFIDEKGNGKNFTHSMSTGSCDRPDVVSEIYAFNNVSDLPPGYYRSSKELVARFPIGTPVESYTRYYFTLLSIENHQRVVLFNIALIENEIVKTIIYSLAVMCSLGLIYLVLFIWRLLVSRGWFGKTQQVRLLKYSNIVFMTCLAIILSVNVKAIADIIELLHPAITTIIVAVYYHTTTLLLVSLIPILVATLYQIGRWIWYKFNV